jgi:hypothetical protein
MPRACPPASSMGQPAQLGANSPFLACCVARQRARRNSFRPGQTGSQAAPDLPRMVCLCD